MSGGAKRKAHVWGVSGEIPGTPHGLPHIFRCFSSLEVVSLLCVSSVHPFPALLALHHYPLRGLPPCQSFEAHIQLT